MTDHELLIRTAELEAVASYLRGVETLLDFGAGAGEQASLLSHTIPSVFAVDIKPHPNPVFPVLEYDGQTIPFRDCKFDCVFSSNVLEHVEDLPVVHTEIKRVLRDNGVVIHIVPTHIWRLWTTITYYPAYPKILWSNFQNLSLMNKAVKKTANSATPQQRTFFRYKWLLSLLMSPRHGVRGNRLTEFWYFRPSWWKHHFEQFGWKILSSYPSGIFYSGNILFGRSIPLRTRQYIARVLGSSTHCFILSPNASRSSRSDTAAKYRL